MSFIEVYGFVVIGVAISVVLPILKRLLPTAKQAGIQGVWVKIKPFIVIGAFSLLTGLLVVALLGNSVGDWRAALLAGYAWDSTLQKLAA